VPGTHAAVGDIVGVAVGAVVGAGEGLALGACVGVLVGTAVGLGLGLAVGTAAHAVWPIWPLVHSAAPQAWHRWYASLSWNLPDGQWKQLVEPRQAVNLPAEQASQSWSCPS
jgi:hypothetical protein